MARKQLRELNRLCYISCGCHVHFERGSWLFYPDIEKLILGHTDIDEQIDGPLIAFCNLEVEFCLHVG